MSTTATATRVGIDQRAASDGALPDRAPDGGDWQIAETASGEVRVWEPSDAERGVPRIALLVASGTRAQIATEDLELAGARRGEQRAADRKRRLPPSPHAE